MKEFEQKIVVYPSETGPRSERSVSALVWESLNHSKKQGLGVAVIDWRVGGVYAYHNDESHFGKGMMAVAGDSADGYMYPVVVTESAAIARKEKRLGVLFGAIRPNKDGIKGFALFLKDQIAAQKGRLEPLNWAIPEDVINAKNDNQVLAMAGTEGAIRRFFDLDEVKVHVVRESELLTEAQAHIGHVVEEKDGRAVFIYPSRGSKLGGDLETATIWCEEAGKEMTVDIVGVPFREIRHLDDSGVRREGRNFPESGRYGMEVMMELEERRSAIIRIEAEKIAIDQEVRRLKIEERARRRLKILADREKVSGFEGRLVMAMTTQIAGRRFVVDELSERLESAFKNASAEASRVENTARLIQFVEKDFRLDIEAGEGSAFLDTLDERKIATLLAEVLTQQLEDEVVIDYAQTELYSISGKHHRRFVTMFKNGNKIRVPEGKLRIDRCWDEMLDELRGLVFAE